MGRCECIWVRAPGCESVWVCKRLCDSMHVFVYAYTSRAVQYDDKRDWLIVRACEIVSVSVYEFIVLTHICIYSYTPLRPTHSYTHTRIHAYTPIVYSHTSSVGKRVCSRVRSRVWDCECVSVQCWWVPCVKKCVANFYKKIKNGHLWIHYIKGH